MGQALDIVNTFYDLTNHQRHTKGMEQLIAEDMSFWGPLQTVSGAKAYMALNEQLLQFHAGVEMAVQIEDGDSVCSIYDLLMQSPAGGTFAIPMVDWLRVVNGRIAEQRVYYDPRTFLEAFGMEVTGKARPAKTSGRALIVVNEEGSLTMGQLNYHPEQKAALDHVLLDYPEVSAGVVFGLPCYKVNEVVFATLWGEGVGIKLSEARVRELLEQPGYVPFRPFGRSRGKQFVQINHENPHDYQHDKPLFEEAMRYAFSASTNQKDPSLQRLSLEEDKEEQRFRSIAALLARENSAITLGKMMSEPALQYQGKVFAFYYGKKMVFRLGRDFQPELFNIQHYRLLAPFKTKPPMVDWFEIPFDDQHRWEELSRYALGRLGEQEVRE